MLKRIAFFLFACMLVSLIGLIGDKALAWPRHGIGGGGSSCPYPLTAVIDGCTGAPKQFVSMAIFPYTVTIPTLYTGYAQTTTTTEGYTSGFASGYGITGGYYNVLQSGSGYNALYRPQYNTPGDYPAGVDQGVVPTVASFTNPITSVPTGCLASNTKTLPDNVTGTLKYINCTNPSPPGPLIISGYDLLNTPQTINGVSTPIGAQLVVDWGDDCFITNNLMGNSAFGAIGGTASGTSIQCKDIVFSDNFFDAKDNSYYNLNNFMPYDIHLVSVGIGSTITTEHNYYRHMSSKGITVSNASDPCGLNWTDRYNLMEGFNYDWTTHGEFRFTACYSPYMNASASWTTSSSTIQVPSCVAFGATMTAGEPVYDTTISITTQIGTVSTCSGTTLTLTAPAAYNSSGSSDQILFVTGVNGYEDIEHNTSVQGALYGGTGQSSLYAGPVNPNSYIGYYTELVNPIFSSNVSIANINPIKFTGTTSGTNLTVTDATNSPFLVPGDLPGVLGNILYSGGTTHQTIAAGSPDGHEGKYVLTISGSRTLWSGWPLEKATFTGASSGATGLGTLSAGNGGQAGNVLVLESVTGQFWPGEAVTDNFGYIAAGGGSATMPGAFTGAPAASIACTGCVVIGKRGNYTLGSSSWGSIGPVAMIAPQGMGQSLWLGYIGAVSGGFVNITVENNYTDPTGSQCMLFDANGSLKSGNLSTSNKNMLDGSTTDIPALNGNSNQSSTCNGKFTGSFP